MIWALEAAESFGRLSCSECTPEKQRKLGCGKDKVGVVGERVFRSTSPSLLCDGKPGELRECPVGLVLREAPYVYKAISAASHVDNGSSDPTAAPTWLQSMMRVVGSERARHRELKDKNRTTAGDADHARQVVNRG